MPANTAAWLTAAGAKPLEVKSAPYNSPGENEITIKNHALAINPIDWAIQEMGENFPFPIPYPFIGGNDTTGEVVEVGPNITRFKPGDRVLGHALNLTMPLRGAAFQAYTVLRTNMASPIPSTLSYENAAVIPLGLSTAACGLYQKDYLALPHPSLSPNPTGKTLLIWGGSTSVGSNAIQLAVASGHEVFTTCSARNFPFVKSLGAAQIFDYNSPSIVSDILTALKNKSFAGAFAIGNANAPNNGAAGADTLLEIVNNLPTTTTDRKFVAMALIYPMEKVPKGVDTKFVFGSDLKDNEVSHAVYGDFLPKALQEGVFKAMPEPLVVGRGLESVQGALERQREGISARKVVVSLE